MWKGGGGGQTNRDIERMRLTEKDRETANDREKKSQAEEKVRCERNKQIGGVGVEERVK